MFKFKPSLIYVAVSSVMACGAAVAAEETTLGEVTVVATKTRLPVDRVPASVSTATFVDLETTQATSIAPVVRAMPNVEMAGGPRLDALVPIIRGAYGGSVTLLLDGARQNDVQSPGMKSPLYSDPYYLKQIEVLRGAASSLYGTGGNGGVMALTTLSAKDLLAVGQSLGGGFKAGYSSADNSSHVNARVYGGNDAADALLALGTHDWNKVRQGDGEYLEPNNGYSKTGLFKLGMNPGQGSRIEFSHQFYESGNFAPNNPLVKRYKLTSDPFNAAIPFLQPQHISQRNTVLKGSHGDVDGNDGPRVEWSVYQSFLKIQMDPYGTNPNYSNAANTTYSNTVTETSGASVQMTKTMGSHRLALGGDFYIDTLDSRSGATASTVNVPGERRGAGMFVQDEWALGGGWKFIPTLRHDQYKAVQGGSSTPENREARFSPKGTIAWEDNKGLLLYSSFGEGFRAPTANELFQNSQVGIFTWFYPNLTLKPEIDKTLELGAKLKTQGVFVEGDSLRLRGAAFDSHVKDMISSVTLGNIPGQTSCFVTGTGCRTQYQNIPNAHRVGAEVEAIYNQKLWQYNVAYGRVRVTNDDTSEKLFATPDKLTTQVHRKLPNQNMSLMWNGTFVASQKYDSTENRRRAGYAVHDLFLSWMPNGQKFRVDAGVSNVFDKAYALYLSSNVYANAYQEGRSYKVALSADF